MNNLKSAKEKLELLEEQRETIFLEIKENYKLEDEFYNDTSDVENVIYAGDILLGWQDNRDIDYSDDSLQCNNMLVNALEFLEMGDENSIQIANEIFESVVLLARKVKADREEDIAKAQGVISFMNEIINVCDSHLNMYVC